MFRACELKDQTYKKTRTLHFSESRGLGVFKSRFGDLSRGFRVFKSQFWGV